MCYFDVKPGNSVTQTGAQGFQEGFLGSKARGIAGRTTFSCRTVCSLLFGENAMQKGCVVLINKTLKSFDGNYVCADS
jgi:hypothetical protein